MLVSLAIVIVIGLILCTLWAIAQNSTAGYAPKLKVQPGRHRAAHRAVGYSTAQLSRAASERAEHNAARAHIEYERWLEGIAPTPDRRLDELDFAPAPDRRFDALATRALDAKAHLERKGLRLRHASPWGTPESDDVWEPQLVTAA